MRLRSVARRVSGRRARGEQEMISGDTERLLLSGRVPGQRQPDPDDPGAVADTAVEEAVHFVETILPNLADDRAQDGLLQVGRNLSVAMRHLAPYRTGTDARLRAAYTAVHEAITDLAAVFAWLTYGPNRAGRVQHQRQRPRDSGTDEERD